jgi:pentatricopeptide repeat protein
VLSERDSSAASVCAALRHTAPGFAPGLPGLTKLVSKFAKEGDWQKALEVFKNVHVLGLQADTTITNAAIAACGVGHDVAQARDIFNGMRDAGLSPDPITYKALIAVLVRCGEWHSAIEVRIHTFR